MNAKQIWMTTHDMERLLDLIDGLKAVHPKRKTGLKQWAQELGGARIVNPQDMPQNVIR